MRETTLLRAVPKGMIDLHIDNKDVKNELQALLAEVISRHDISIGTQINNAVKNSLIGEPDCL
jgi:hypothetical protein